MIDINEPGITDYVRELRKWGEYKEAFPTLRVPYSERTLAQHLECWSICEDPNWRRLVFLGVHDIDARLLADAALFGVGPDDLPDAEVLRYLRSRLHAVYLDMWQMRVDDPATRDRALAMQSAGAL